METVVTLEQWLRRGTQRAAVLQALRKPMPASEVCRAARHINPHLQLRDLWLVLPPLKERGLVVCLTPRQANGKLYALTPMGRRLVHQAFAVEPPAVPRLVNWRDYSWVVRAKTRRLTLDGLARLSEKTSHPQTASAVRRFLRAEHSVGLNPVLRSLKELLGRGLVRVAGTTEEQARRLYQLTLAGERIVTQLRR
ncbi:MAG: hypothetical protein FJW31_07430 [Acidobacteria bacterium]|nr:hypothetical protein [Acidobacteriota bacterium]